MARKSRKGKSAKNNPAQNKDEPEELKKAPHTFVIYRGQVGKCIAELTKDFRKLMEPFTASKLKVLKSNVLKDFVSVAGPMNVTHMISFSKSEISNFMRIIRLPHGPTLTFRIEEYALAKDVVSSLKRPISYAKQFAYHPLLILNNFSGDGHHIKLLATTFQNLFPSININKIKLNMIRRCVLLHYNAEDGTIEFRHYTIKVIPSGMSKGVKKLVQSKIPNLSNFSDISEFLLKDGILSESEVEQDGPHNQVILPQPISSRGNIMSQQSAIRLIEMGPRLKLSLVKIEEGLMDGETIYHNRVTKSAEEKEILRAKKETKKKLKEQRKRQQEEDVKRKQRQKEKPERREKNDDQEDDRAWFKKETGMDAEEDLFPKSQKRKREMSKVVNKRRKFKK